MYGVLDRRKCIGVLLDAAARLRDVLDLTIFLAGPQDSHVPELLSGKAACKLRERDSLVEVNRFILNGKDIDPLGAADVCWVFYEHNTVYSSNVLIQSGLARRPVIARRRGLIGRLVEDHKLGLALNFRSARNCRVGPATPCREPRASPRDGRKWRARVRKEHAENFARPILDGINAALHRTPQVHQEIIAVGQE